MSNRIITSDIAPGRKLPLTKERLDFIQDNTEQLASSIALGILGTYTTGDIIIWKGCVFTGTDPGARTMTAGVIYYNGLFYQVPSASFTTIGSNIPLWTKVTIKSDFATFSDGFNADVEQTQTFVLVAGPAGGSGVTGYIADYNSSTVKQLEPIGVKTAWTSLTLINGWAATSVVPSYRLDGTGKVQLRGVLVSDAATNVSFAVIPTGLKPANARLFSVYNNLTGGLTSMAGIGVDYAQIPTPAANNYSVQGITPATTTGNIGLDGVNYDVY